MNDWFPYFWLTMIAFIGLFNLVWTIRDVKVGNTKLSWMGNRLYRETDTFEFWMTIVAKGAGVIVACFMFVFGLQMLKW